MNYLRIKCESLVILESVADQPDDTVVTKHRVVAATTITMDCDWLIRHLQ